MGYFRLFLKRKLSNLQWMAIILLTVGTTTSQVILKSLAFLVFFFYFLCFPANGYVPWGSLSTHRISGNRINMQGFFSLHLDVDIFFSRLSCCPKRKHMLIRILMIFQVFKSSCFTSYAYLFYNRKKIFLCENHLLDSCSSLWICLIFIYSTIFPLLSYK